jgi:hypothetical protein
VRRRGELIVRCAALDVIAAGVEGLGDMDRAVPAVHAEALKAAAQFVRDRSDDRARAAAAGVLQAVASAGGAGLWAGGGGAYEAAVQSCVAGLEDPNRAVRDAFAVALGRIAVACNAQAAQVPASFPAGSTCQTRLPWGHLEWNLRGKALPPSLLLPTHPVLLA